MAAWLTSIVGVVVIGAVVELLTQNTTLGRFVRAVYSFFVLFVIVEPIPRMLSVLSGGM